MSTAERFKRYEQHQGQLFPAHLSEGLDPSDSVFFIDDVIEGLDLTAFEQRYSVNGEHAYPPRLLLKLWLFGATQGVHSGREIARRLSWDLRFRYLAGSGPQPDFRTINRFRARHVEDFAGLFRQTVHLARTAGMAKLGVVTVDGSKIRANTSKHKAMSHGRMRKEEERLEAEIAEILEKMDEVNRAEDEEHGEDGDGGGGLPAELTDRRKRQQKIRELREQLEAEKGEKLKDRHQKSFADADAQMMKTGDGAFQYAYNAQAAASEDGFIVAAEVTTAVRDIGELVPMADQIKANTGERAGRLLADNGYLSEQGLRDLRRRRQACLVATGRERKKPGRRPKAKWAARMERTLRLPWAKQCYARRKTQGERPFAEIKVIMGLRAFMLRGTAKVRGEWALVSSAFNLRRMMALAATVS
jgi:transposase